MLGARVQLALLHALFDDWVQAVTRGKWRVSTCLHGSNTYRFGAPELKCVTLCAVTGAWARRGLRGAEALRFPANGRLLPLLPLGPRCVRAAAGVSRVLHMPVGELSRWLESGKHQCGCGMKGAG